MLQSITMMKRTAAIVFSAFLITGCTAFNPGVATVWTNIPEIAAYAEMYNAAGDRVRINAVYKENPGRIPSGLDKADMPDIIIGTYINSIKTIGLFSSLEGLFGEDGLSEDEFYPGILSLGVNDGQKVLIPLSFDIQGLKVRKSDTGLSSVLLSLEDMQRLSLEHTKTAGQRTQYMGFSPAWTDDGGMMFARLMNAAFRENSIGTLIWNNEALNKAVSFSRQWIEETNGGYSRDQEFIQKYLYDPGRKLLISNPPRIRFYPVTLSAFARLPSQDREPLDIVWLHNNDKIEVLENIVFAGILKGSQTKRISQEFITWIASVKTQKTLLESTRFKRIRTFGIANGLSSLVKINENVFPEYYTFLVGRIPPAKYLHFPASVPSEWPNLRKEIIGPWIKNALCSENQPKDSLPEDIHKWYLQQPDY